MSTVNITINGQPVSVTTGTTILEAARQCGVKIPTLCHHPDQAVKANCRVCVVEVEGQKKLQTACSTQVSDGMNIYTNTARVIEARKTILELILAHHPQDCLHCTRNGQCELQNLAMEYNVRDCHFPRDNRDLPLDDSSPAIIRDPNKCILCERCIEVCCSIQTVNTLGLAYRGYDSLVVPGLNKPLSETDCVMCGQCIHACPVGAIYEKEQIDDFFAATADSEKIIVTQIAPAVQVAIAEEMGLTMDELSIDKLVAGFKALGFDYVLHTNFAADLTIMEEGNELLKRIQEGGTLPMFTSCCPAWIRFAEIFYPQQIKHLSTCKSPQQMFGSLVKTYWADKMGINPANIYSVSIMPCTAKKYEANRPEMKDSGFKDVDLVLTTREISRMFNMTGINPVKLEGKAFDPWMAQYSGAAALFGATGGVMEAALRTVYELVTGKELENLDFTEVRGMEGIREAELDMDGTLVKVAVAHGLGNARKIMEDVAKGTSPYHFVEVMACPGGCVGGGGQPITASNVQRAARIEALYNVDKSMSLRKSHENQEIRLLYNNFLQKPLGFRSHDLLHTHYAARYHDYKVYKSK